MAINAKYMTSSGIELEDAYVNIATIYISKQINNGFMANLVANVYASQEAYIIQRKDVETFNLMFLVDDTTDIFSQAYELLKINPSFTWKGDC